jgi:hypothetical protein
MTDGNTGQQKRQGKGRQEQDGKQGTGRHGRLALPNDTTTNKTTDQANQGQQASSPAKPTRPHAPLARALCALCLRPACKQGGVGGRRERQTAGRGRNGGTASGPDFPNMAAAGGCVSRELFSLLPECQSRPIDTDEDNQRKLRQSVFRCWEGVSIGSLPARQRLLCCLRSQPRHTECACYPCTTSAVVAAAFALLDGLPSPAKRERGRIAKN